MSFSSPFLKTCSAEFDFFKTFQNDFNIKIKNLSSFKIYLGKKYYFKQHKISHSSFDSSLEKLSASKWIAAKSIFLLHSQAHITCIQARVYKTNFLCSCANNQTIRNYVKDLHTLQLHTLVRVD